TRWPRDWSSDVCSSDLVRIKLAIALLLTLVILPLHRTAYQVDLSSMSALGVLMMHEIVIGIVLGATARVTLSALAVAGSVIAQRSEERRVGKGAGGRRS